MTDNHIDEKLIASFFEAHQIGEIEDRGFSRRVMRRLPESRMRRLNTVWTLLGCGRLFHHAAGNESASCGFNPSVEQSFRGCRHARFEHDHSTVDLCRTCCGDDFWGVSCLEKCAKVYLGRLLYGAIYFRFI